MAMALRGPEFSTLDATLHDYKFARELGLSISVHVGSGEWGKGRPVAKLKEHKLLGTDVTYVHCNTLADDEIQIIADSGGSASVSPEVEMQMEMGFPAAGRLVAAGVRPSLSLDVPNALGVNMFSQMRFLLEVQRAMDNEKAINSKQLLERFPMNCRDVLEFATIAGARTLGLDRKTGSLTPGKEADLILVRTDTLSMTPLNNPVGQVVLAGHPGMIDRVFVAGRCVKRDGRLVDLDVGRIRQMAIASQEYLFKAAGVKAGGEWIPDVYEAHDTEAAAAVTSGTT
jgi:cytosine/adenosine deaminase-related metal-dependent hydrolase